MIKFLDLEKINNRFRDEIDLRIKTILDNGWYLQGEENETFTKNFAKYCGTKHCIGVANGLDALNLIIKAMGFGVGDEIIVPANTYIASILAITQNGCTPVLVEPDKKYGYTYLEICKKVKNMSVDELEKNGFDIQTKKYMNNLLNGSCFIRLLKKLNPLSKIRINNTRIIKFLGLTIYKYNK